MSVGRNCWAIHKELSRQPERIGSPTLCGLIERGEPSGVVRPRAKAEDKSTNTKTASAARHAVRSLSLTSCQRRQEQSWAPVAASLGEGGL